MTAVPDPASAAPSPHGNVFWGEPPARDVVLVRGGDAVRFIDGFQTAAVAKLAPDRGTESFFTDGRGHVLALANILRPALVPECGGLPPVQGESWRSAADAGSLLWIDLPLGTATALVEHLEHYHIREDVEFHVVGPPASTDRGPSRGLFVGGAAAADWLAAAGGSRFAGRVPRAPLDVATGRLGGEPVSLVRTDRHGPGGFELFAADLPRLRGWLAATGMPRAPDEFLEELRILARHPEPRDIPPKTLPQELDRPAAISFTKGCYLGQETVARLDALGHVNRRLAVVALDGAPPEPPAAVLDAAGTQVGTMTSACRSTRLEMPHRRDPAKGLGLAIVHVRAHAAGAALSVAGLGARLVEPVSQGPGGAPGDGS